MNLSQAQHIIFIGIGGIGMSALARYFLAQKKQVLGYDKTPTDLTQKLEQEGANITYADLWTWDDQINAANTIAIYTPAIPKNAHLFAEIQRRGIVIIKRAKALGLITEETKNLSIAGTHGKTTTSCLLAHLLHVGNVPSVAFLGGISSNFNSNYTNTLQNHTAGISVTEADEFDRSFLQLKPFSAAITNMDADHLDIYGTSDNLTKSFKDFASLVSPLGKLYVQEKLAPYFNQAIVTYGIGQGHVSAQHVHVHDGKFVFDLYTEDTVIPHLVLGIPGNHNVENAVAASCLALDMGVSEDALREGLRSFKGVKRRFEYILEKPFVYIDDYAHHPTELDAIISSVKMLYPNKKVTGIFQPHLFSRTRDFMLDFAKSLSTLDEVVLLDIYPARELPIDGVSSQALLDHITADKHLLQTEEVISFIEKNTPEVLLTLGAGDIDRLVQPIHTHFNQA